jgi:GxxExxY protein
MTQAYLDQLTYKILGCAIEVHKTIGPGLLESIYEKCFEEELKTAFLNFRKQLYVLIKYKGKHLDAELRLDFLVEDIIVVELKAVEALHPVYEAQLLTYMQLLQKPKGILINFNCTNIFKEGQRTRVNQLYAALPKE